MSQCIQMVSAQGRNDGVSTAGNYTAARGTRNGAAFSADWIQAAINEGRGFSVNVGSFSTPVQGGGAGTTPVIGKPQFAIGVPGGSALLPFHVGFHVAVPLLAADADTSEVILGIDKSHALPTDGTATVVVPSNLLVAGVGVASSPSSQCTAKTAYTAAMTSPQLDLELTHRFMKGDVNGTAANALWTTDDVFYDPRTVPIILGPAILLGYWGGTVAHFGFAEVQWIEFPATMFC